MEAGFCFLKTRNGGQEVFCGQEPHKVLFSFTYAPYHFETALYLFLKIQLQFLLILLQN